MIEIYSKTAKGQEEIKTRAGGLSQRTRQLLIFVDGKRTVGDLHGLLKAEDFDDMLSALAQQGFIEISEVIEKEPSTTLADEFLAEIIKKEENETRRKDAELAEQRRLELEEKKKLDTDRKRKMEEERRKERERAHNFLSKM